MQISRRYRPGPTLPALLLACSLAVPALGQPAPAPRAVVPADNAPQAMTGMFAETATGVRTISIDGAQWLQLRFGDVDLGDGGTLTIVGADGQTQIFSQDQIEAWAGLTAMFGGAQLTVTVTPGEEGGATAEIADIIVGLPADTGAESPDAIPQALRDTLGPDFGRFIVTDTPRQPREGGTEEALPPGGSTIESICGTADNRVVSNHPFSGRIMPIGCTGWIISSGAILTAGHCIGTSTQILEFDVPPSLANGTTQPAAVTNQYPVLSASIVDDFTGIGNDWAVFEVGANTQTGLTPIQAQGGGFIPSSTASPGTVTITGYGVDGPSPNFGNPPPRNADNQTQQTHDGAVTQHDAGGPNSAVIRYEVDTQGGNSGSPVFTAGNVAVAIHTNGGCGPSGGANAGTSLRNGALWSAVQASGPPIGGGDFTAGWLNLLLAN